MFLLIIVFDYFLFNFAAPLKFWGNPEIQDGGSKIATILAIMT